MNFNRYLNAEAQALTLPRRAGGSLARYEPAGRMRLRMFRGLIPSPRRRASSSTLPKGGLSNDSSSHCDRAARLYVHRKDSTPVQQLLSCNVGGESPNSCQNRNNRTIIPLDSNSFRGINWLRSLKNLDFRCHSRSSLEDQTIRCAKSCTTNIHVIIRANPQRNYRPPQRKHDSFS